MGRLGRSSASASSSVKFKGKFKIDRVNLQFLLSFARANLQFACTHINEFVTRIPLRTPAPQACPLRDRGPRKPFILSLANKLFLIGLNTIFLLQSSLFAQSYTISGTITSSENTTANQALVELENQNIRTQTNEKGFFELRNIQAGTYQLLVFRLGKEAYRQQIEVVDRDVEISIQLQAPVYELDAVDIEGNDGQTFGISRLNDVEGTAIYAAKKNEVVVLKDVIANKATNNSRQVYGKVPGLNIWESDGAGVQLGIGGRGLSPNRNSNFNTRQNGYDISADALGYPESYYTPPVEALQKIEIVRGAAGLQYGTQFGGMLNFKFREGPRDKKLQVLTRQTIGSFGLFNSFNSFGGTVGKVNYYSFYQYKRSNGWRPNSSLDQHTGHLAFTWQINPKLSLRPEYTFTTYLAQQPGGLTDAQFQMDPRQSNRERNWFNVDWNLFSLTFDYIISPQTHLNSRTFGLLAGRDALGNLDRINLIDFGENRDFISDDFKNWGNETRLIHRYSTFDNPSVFLFGFRVYDGFTVRRQGDGNDGSGPDFYYLNPDRLEGSDFDLPSENIALFSENIFKLSPTFSVTPGLRFEYINTRADGFYRNTVRDLANNIILDEVIEEEKGSKRSFVFAGLGLSWKPNEQIELYSNFSQNYRAINFNDIRVSVGSLVVDPNLTDERGFNADLGFRAKREDYFNIDISVFHLAYRDRVGTVLRTEPNPQFNGLVDRTFRFRTNVADASIYGLEAFGEINILKLLRPAVSDIKLSLFGNFAWIEANYVNSQDPSIEGNAVELVPPINLKAGLNFQWKSFRSSFQYAYVDTHFSDATNAIRTSSAIEGLIPSYQIMDFSASYELNKFISLEAGINNLGNEFYFTRRATGYPGPGIIPSDGRSFYGTVQIKL